MDLMVVFFWIWVILAASLYIGEMLSASFFLLPFAIGATVAIIINMLGLNVAWQWVIFLLVSLAALAALRPLANRLTRGSDARTGVDRLLGMEALIIDQPAPENLRRARVDGELWNVELEPPIGVFVPELDVGERVWVARVEGARLIVRRYDQPTM